VTGDRAVFRDVRLLGNQDTVYAAGKGCSAEAKSCAPARQYFADCYIEGNVGFIFGDGKAVFENCDIHNTLHKGGYVTAQGKNVADEDSAFVFSHCRLTAEPGVTGVWLGRPWRPYASVIFLNTEMGGRVSPAGWREWHPGETHYLETVFCAEYNSSGPGAHPHERDPHAKFLTAEEAAQSETESFLAGKAGWNPVAGLKNGLSRRGL
jgi:pectin methylesterase-like acyl-CoA thioesterase